MTLALGCVLLTGNVRPPRTAAGRLLAGTSGSAARSGYQYATATTDGWNDRVPARAGRLHILRGAAR